MGANKNKISLGVLLSGSGRTLENIFQQIESGDLNAEVKVVISNKPGVKGLSRAEERGVETHVVKWSDYPDVDSVSNVVTEILDRHSPDLVLLAGFLKFYKVPDHYMGEVMNIHPALIPAFCGENLYGHYVHEAVLKCGAKVSGCTVHFADNVYDNGPIIIQRTVPVLDDDTPDTLAARVFEEECKAYPEAIRLFADGKLKVVEGTVKIS